MPPKKSAPKTKDAAQGTVTTSRGKAHETTAAAARTKRERTVVSDAPAAKATQKNSTAAAASAAGKKRGRAATVAEEETEAIQPQKKRGRPSKSASTAATPAKKPGRAAKSNPAPAVPLNETAPPKKRGRPPKGGETTKIDAAEEAAAEQLEEELVDAVEGEHSKPTSSVKRVTGRPPKKAAGLVKQLAAHDNAEDEAADANEYEAAASASGRQYWLMKAEQEDREETLKDGSVFNAKFTIDDLRDRNGPEPWDGVRNPTACKNMKAMKLGDLAFFYASGGKKGRVPGITGIMEIVKEYEPDLSAFDENSPFYVENAKQRGSQEQPRWMMVHVEYRKKLSKPVTLSELKKFAETGRVLSEMQEFTAARLSVSKVTQKEWDFIVKELIEGYKDDVPTSVNGIEAKGVEIVKTT